MDDIKQLEIKVLTIPEKARAIKVIDNETYALACDALLEIKGLRKQIDASFDPIIELQNKAHKEAIAQKKKVALPLTTSEGILKPEISAWDTEQERLRREKERKLNDIKRKKEEDARLEQAAALEKAGDTATANEVLDAPVTIMPVEVAKTVPKVEGVSFSVRWRYRVNFPYQVPREFLKLDEVKIGQYVRMKKASGKIPGIEIYSEKVVAGRG